MNEAVLAFLLTVGCSPTAEIIVEPTLSGLEYYQDGKLYVRPGVADHVYVHGLYHDCQYQKHGRATSQYEWRRRENQAVDIERMFRERILDGRNIDNLWR